MTWNDHVGQRHPIDLAREREEARARRCWWYPQAVAEARALVPIWNLESPAERAKREQRQRELAEKGKRP